MLKLIAISADFDPVHKGHEKLIKEGRKLADEKQKKLVVYLNKGYSANHGPIFVNFEASFWLALFFFIGIKNDFTIETCFIFKLLIVA